MKSFSSPEHSNPQPLKDRVIGDNAEVLDELGTRYPDFMPALERLTTDASISNEEFFEIIESFNQSHMLLEGEGSYQTVHLRGNHGDITIKYYKNGSTSISGSWRGLPSGISFL